MKQSEVVLVTPDMAKGWLDTSNTKNRKLSMSHVHYLAAAMSKGDWVLGPDPISFDHDGRLTNGQHRLYAVIEADTPQEFHVVRGLDPMSFFVTDTGKRRTFTDFLSISGEKNASELAHVVGMYARYQATGGFKPFKNEDRPTVADMFRILEGSPGLRSSIPIGQRTQRALHGGGALWSAIYFILSGLPDAQTDADVFFDTITSGIGLQIGDPCYALRARLLDPIRLRQRLQPHELGALVFKAWNAYRRGQQVQILGWKQGGASPEAYPIPE